MQELRGHIPALDAIRGFAIIVVTLYRFGQLDVHEPLARFVRTIFGRGYLGVDLFFVLSGFLITGILFDAKDQSHYFSNFYFRRSLRIFPLYYFALIVGLVILPAILPGGSSELARRPEYSWSLWFYGANLTQCWTNHWSLGPFNHFWSLAVEEHFYLVWPCVIYFCDRRAAMRACTACVGIGLVSKVACVGLAESPIAAEVLTFCRLDALGVGGWLALAAREPGGLTRLSQVWRPVAGAMLVLLAVLFAGSKALPHSHALEKSTLVASASTPVAVLFGALIIGAVTASPASILGRCANLDLLKVAGKYSYGWYVFQGLIAPDINRYLPGDVLVPLCCGSELLAIITKTLLGGSFSLLLAILSWHCFEAPVLRLRDQNWHSAFRRSTSLALEGEVTRVNQPASSRIAT